MRLDVHIHHHHPQLDDLLREIHDLRRVIMATKQEVLDKLQRVNSAVTAVAADVAALKRKLETAGDVDPEIVAAVDAIDSRLTALDAETEDEPNPDPEASTG